MLTIKDAKNEDVNLKTTTEGDEEILNTSASSLSIGVSGPHELIGTNEQVDKDRYSASLAANLGGTYSGEIFQISLVSTGGDIITPSGNLYVFDDNPVISVNDSSITESHHIDKMCHIGISSYDWVSDANGANVSINKNPIMFHPTDTLYFAWQHTYEASFNDDAGDDEKLMMKFWFRRDT